MIVYGLKVCDTTKKALKALQGRGAALHDLRENPVSAQVLGAWLERLGPKLVNRASTTWRGLDEAEKALPEVELLSRYPTLIKRPVIEEGDKLTLGWTAEAQSAWSA